MEVKAEESALYAKTEEELNEFVPLEPEVWQKACLTDKLLVKNNETGEKKLYIVSEILRRPSDDKIVGIIMGNEKTCLDIASTRTSGSVWKYTFEKVGNVLGIEWEQE